MRRVGWVRALAAAAILAAVAAGCSDGAGDGSSSSASGEMSRDAAVAGLPDALKGPQIGSQAEDRQVIYTGSLRVRVGDVETAAAKARTLATEAGGYLAAQQAELEGDQEIRLTLRIPAGRFDQVTDALADLGTVQAREVASEDVTDQVVDLEGRLENARISAQRLRELLAGAENIQNITTLEDKLTQRETEIEGLSGQLEVLADQATLSTIEVSFTEKAEQTVSDDLPGPLESLRSGFVTLINLLLIGLAVVAFLLPFAPFLALAWWLRRRWSRRRAAKHASAPPPAWGVDMGWRGPSTERPPPPDAREAGRPEPPDHNG